MKGLGDGHHGSEASASLTFQVFKMKSQIFWKKIVNTQNSEYYYIINFSAENSLLALTMSFLIHQRLKSMAFPVPTVF